MHGPDFIDAISATWGSGAVKAVKDQDTRVYDILHSLYNLFYDNHLKKKLSRSLSKKLIKDLLGTSSNLPRLCSEIAGTKSNNSVSLCARWAAMQKGQMWVQSLIIRVCLVTERHVARLEVNPNRSKCKHKLFQSNCLFWEGGKVINFQSVIWPEEGSIIVHVRTILHTGPK